MTNSATASISSPRTPPAALRPARWLRVLAATGTMLTVLGCDEPAVSLRIEPAGGPGYGSVILDAATDDPLEPRFFSLARDGTVIAVERTMPQVWAFSIGSPPASRLVATLDVPRRTGIVAMAVSGDHAATLDVRGRLRVMDLSSGVILDTMDVIGSASSHVVGLAGSARGGWYLLEERMTRTAEGLIDSLVLSRIVPGHGRLAVWSEEKFGPHNPEMLFLDYTSITAMADTIWIGGASPPRVRPLVVTNDGTITVSETVTLENAPRRPLPETERNELRRMARSSRLDPATVSAMDNYPPVAAAWAVPGGYLVRSGTGRTTFALDRYCGRTFRATVLQGDDVVDVVWLGDVAVVRRTDAEATYFRLDLYSQDQLTVECDK